MNTTQEPKYKIVDGKLFNRQSDEQIPDDEPVFILRARDRHAAELLNQYRLLVLSPTDHWRAVSIRLEQFQRWAKDHPERMKEPDTQLTADWQA